MYIVGHGRSPSSLGHLHKPRTKNIVIPLVGCISPQGAFQKMVNTLTNALTHSKKRRMRKNGRNSLKTTKKLIYNPVEEEKNAQMYIEML